jgi:LPXTG-motif cell wall-anchored protein
MKNTILRIVAILMVLIGIVWTGQGVGLIHGSVMTDDSKWAVIGIIVILVALLILVFTRKRKTG